jgi:hypothetical protein
MKSQNMAFPMIAIGNVSVGQAEYGVGEVFDAKTERSFNFLKSAKAAKPYTEAGVAEVGGQTETAESPNTKPGNAVVTAKGTTDGLEPTLAAAGGAKRPSPKRRTRKH